MAVCTEVEFERVIGSAPRAESVFLGHDDITEVWTLTNLPVANVGRWA